MKQGFWDWVQVHLDWLGHMIEATVQALAIAIVIVLFMRAYGQPMPFATALAIGGLGGVGHFWGREKRDYEREAGLPPPQLSGYFFWRWSWDGKTDFFPVLALWLFYLTWYFFLR